jgi:hypothetical protein
VAAGRLVRFWTSAAELPGLVALSMSKTIKTYPAQGWARAGATSNTELLEEINNLQKTNAELQKQLTDLRAAEGLDREGLAQGEDTFTIKGTQMVSSRGVVSKDKWSVKLTWNEIFGYIGPHLLHPTNEPGVKLNLAASLGERLSRNGTSRLVNDDVIQTIKIQLLALGLITVNSYNTVKGGTALFWELTPKGRAQLLRIRSVRREDDVTLGDAATADT